jgi:predicted aconitase with swiveling domain
MQVQTLKGRKIVEGTCTAEALVSTRPISFLGGVDPADGKIIERDHDLYGSCVKDKVLVFPHGHGSTVGSYMMYSLAKRGLAPAAIVNQTADPVVVVGAIIAKIPMIDQVNIKRIRTGDTVEVDGYKGVARVLKRKEI